MENSVKIHCETTGKLLARRDENGVYLWCKECKVEHFISWVPKDNKSEENADKVVSGEVLCYNLSI
jgi:hypothetical protein